MNCLRELLSQYIDSDLNQTSRPITQITTGQYHCCAGRWSFSSACFFQDSTRWKTHNPHPNKPASDMVDLQPTRSRSWMTISRLASNTAKSWRSSRRPYCGLRYCLVTWSPYEATGHDTWSAYGLICNWTPHRPKLHTKNYWRSSKPLETNPQWSPASFYPGTNLLQHLHKWHPEDNIEAIWLCWWPHYASCTSDVGESREDTEPRHTVSISEYLNHKRLKLSTYR